MKLPHLLRIAVLMALSLASLKLGAQAPEFPSRPVRVIVGFPAGGPNDLIARAIAQQLAQTWKQPVIVENRPGASGLIGSEVVARAEPDGHTLMLGSITHSIVPSLNRKLPFDPIKDFTPVSQVGVAPLMVVVNPALQVASVKELIAYAKAHPGKLSYASTGNGTSIHLASEMFKRMAGIEIVHVPYKGSAPAMADLLGGQVQMMIEAMPSALSHVKSGRLRALAVTTDSRRPEMPDLPTVAEAGLPGFEVTIWWGVFAPGRLPRPLLEKLNAGVNAALQTPEVRRQFATMGVEPTGTTPAYFDELVRRDLERFAVVVEQAGARID